MKHSDETCRGKKAVSLGKVETGQRQILVETILGCLVVKVLAFARKSLLAIYLLEVSNETRR